MRRRSVKATRLSFFVNKRLSTTVSIRSIVNKTQRPRNWRQKQPTLTWIIDVDSSPPTWAPPHHMRPKRFEIELEAGVKPWSTCSIVHSDNVTTDKSIFELYLKRRFWFTPVPGFYISPQMQVLSLNECKSSRACVPGKGREIIGEAESCSGSHVRGWRKWTRRASLQHVLATYRDKRLWLMVRNRCRVVWLENHWRLALWNFLAPRILSQTCSDPDPSI